MYCFFIDVVFFFFQAEDGIRDAQESRGLGDVYKRQVTTLSSVLDSVMVTFSPKVSPRRRFISVKLSFELSLIHI